MKGDFVSPNLTSDYTRNRPYCVNSGHVAASLLNKVLKLCRMLAGANSFSYLCTIKITNYSINY